ncbi:hypothetical protein MNB_SV-9-1381 [hydrothermal vent metagenome]|uniref:Uncharacterized protein n=1 Tax=hydrothermal vent metagenome TaxID=652676 RepID=A0A1W1BDY2_9ZZZZ
MAYNNMGNAYYHLEKFDKAIESYQKAIEINPKRRETYTNLFELQLIQNKNFDKKIENRYIELFANQNDTFIQYDMLKILKNIANGDKGDIESWKQKYRGVTLDWGFDELDEWIGAMGDGAKKGRLIEVVEVFKEHQAKERK